MDHFLCIISLILENISSATNQKGIIQFTGLTNSKLFQHVTIVMGFKLLRKQELQVLRDTDTVTPLFWHGSFPIKKILHKVPRMIMKFPD